jgi:nucleoside-diphosphate-sugar epimerase
MTLFLEPAITYCGRLVITAKQAPAVRIAADWDLSGTRVGSTDSGHERSRLHETFADIEELTRDTGFRPSISIEDGVRDFVAWYRDHYKV